ncbi:MAG: response regulator, partial [Arenibacter sp.]|nr:response regulator [Arenibacter sp.]
MIRCIIIEDQPPAQRVLKKFITDLGNMELKAIFTDAIQAMDYLKTETIDLIFLDIHLPKISGIDFLKALT